MTKWMWVFSALVWGIVVSAGTVMAAEERPSMQQVQSQGQDEQVYGSQLMSPEERADFRERMRAATSAEERKRIRNEHHQLMQERAKQMGVSLPDEPPEQGIGRGRGPGGGMGSGSMGGGRQ